MPTFLVLTKKPAALPILKGSATGWNHLEPVQIVTSDASLAGLPHVEYIPKLDASMIRATGAYRHHTWIALEGEITKAAVDELFKPSPVLTAKGIPTARRAYTMDTRAVEPAFATAINDREADSVIEKPVSLGSILKLKAL